ncbi:MAG: hypothetical protein OEX02_07605 [Cyclobacteriaceae bacterium]|nr:hypothetical protein [Cyclobacteriaceae bacterium]
MSAENLTKDQLLDLVVKGLEKAMESLGFMLKRKLLVLDASVQKSMPELDFGIDANEQLYLLTTEVIGDMKGKSYLFFTEESSAMAFTLLTGMAEPGAMGKDVILQEIDNIASAAVISVFADALKLRIYGDVPYCFVKKTEEVKEILENDHHRFGENSVVYWIKSVLSSEEEDLSMPFYWVLPEETVDMLINKQ